jgi:hypothetical protein
MKHLNGHRFVTSGGVAVIIAVSALASQACEGAVTIGVDDAGGQAGAAGAVGGQAGTAGAAGKPGGASGASTGGASGQAGAGGSGGTTINTWCQSPSNPGETLCGSPCFIEGVNTEFVCGPEGQCVEGPVICGSGLCAGKVCGESCGSGATDLGFTTCDGQGRCVSGLVSCEQPASLCAGKVCGTANELDDSVCTCDANGECIHGSPIDCGVAPCAGLPCGADCIAESFILGVCAPDGRCLVHHQGGIDVCEVSPRCEGKACGADCSGPEIDMPLSCTPQGHCVAASVSCTL